VRAEMDLEQVEVLSQAPTKWLISSHHIMPSFAFSQS